MKKMIALFCYVLLLSQCCIVFSASSIISYSSRTIYVDDDGGADYTSIQDAVDAANNKDTVYVYNGTYYETVTIDKSISIRGENRDSTIIDAQQKDTVVTLSADTITITDFTIQNSKDSATSAGITITSNSNIIKDNHIIFNNGYGIYSENTQHNDIIFNTIHYNKRHGIYLESIQYFNIKENMIGNNSGWYFNKNIPLNRGIEIRSGLWTTISDNIFYHNPNIDLLIISSTFMNIKNNEFAVDGGISLTGTNKIHYTSHTINDNLIDRKPIYYYKNEQYGKQVPADAAQVILANCHHFNISNLHISEGDMSICLGFSTNNKISNNVISHTLDAISLEWSDNNTICNNDISNIWGVPLLYSSHNRIAHNTITDSYRYGLGLWYSSHNNSVYHNKFSDNNEDGLIVYESSFNDITLNTIQHNNLSGINVYGSCCNTIAGNTIENNLDFGVKISSTFSQQAKNNCFHHNNFIQNIPSNAYVREHNMWDLGGLGGNYWDDYIGVDSDSDGFGDEPYVLGGGNEDFYPYMHKIIVSFPEKPGTPIGPSSASIHKNVSFHFYCTHPGEYQLYYLVDWGDDSIDEWFGPFPSDEAVELSHSWEKKGEYGVKVKTRNVLGAESEWSDLLPVSMPKNSNSLEKSLSNEDQENNGIILMLAFPTEFYEYETNYTFMCPGGGYGLWISCDGIHYNTFCGAVLEKDNFIGIANPIIILGIKIR